MDNTIVYEYQSSLGLLALLHLFIIIFFAGSTLILFRLKPWLKNRKIHYWVIPDFLFGVLITLFAISLIWFLIGPKSILIENKIRSCIKKEKLWTTEGEIKSYKSETYDRFIIENFEIDGYEFNLKSSKAENKKNIKKLAVGPIINENKYYRINFVVINSNTIILNIEEKKIKYTGPNK